MRNSSTERIGIEMVRAIEEIQKEAHNKGLDLSKTQASNLLAQEYKRLRCKRINLELKL